MDDLDNISVMERKEDFKEILDIVQAKKIKYIKSQQFETASYLRDIEKLVLHLIEYSQPHYSNPILEEKFAELSKLFHNRK